MSRSRRVLTDLEITNRLEEIFGLPDDPDISDDGLESDEDEVAYSTAKLQRILEKYEEPNDGPRELTPEPSSSPILHAIQPSRVQLSPQVPQSPQRDRPRRVTRVEVSPSSSNIHQISEPRTKTPVNIYEDSETEDSDGDEEMWKKSKWATYRPTPSVFDEIPMAPPQMFSSRIRPVTLFEKFFTDEVYESIIYQTNLYAEQEKIEGWTDLEVKELKAFIGIIIIMGYIILPSIDLYWSSDPGFRIDEIADTMPVKRFKKILQCLHLNDNSQLPAKTSVTYDKLYKLRPMLDFVNHACLTNARDSSSQSIDESMILFKGRSSMKQYMPLKPIKRGYKVWCRCDSYTGYLYEFYIYTGKSETGSEEGLGYKVVKSLTEKLIDKALEEYHIIITFDNFFCDYNLLQYLYENGIYATGTVRRNRKDLPALIKGKRKLKLAKGEFKWRVKGNVAFMVWQDTKEVLLLSNAFHPKIGKDNVSRTQKDGTKKVIKCPTALKEYTKRMGGVDRFDQAKSSYSVGRRSKKWWLRIFYFLLDVGITNSYLLYCQNQNITKVSNLEFRVSVARGLISGFTSRKRRSTPYICRNKAVVSEKRQKVLHVVNKELRYTNVGEHMPIESPTYKRCNMCSTKEKDKRSKIICEKCGVPLCITPCFTSFHRE